MAHLRLRLLRIWLLSLIIAVVAGCGGHDDGDLDFGDAAIDARFDVASDRTGDAGNNNDARDDVAADGRIDVAVDTRVDPTIDPRIDPTVDPRVDPVVDVRVDPRVDAVVDVRVDPTVDVRPPDVVVVDVRVDPRVDVPTDSGPACTTDAQCVDSANPHCNANTHKCVYPVALSVTPANTSIALGTTQQFTAVMTYSDASTGNVTAQATWVSSNTGVAPMSTSTTGLANGMGLGTTSISAIFSGSSGNFSGATNLTVTAATLQTIQVTPANQSRPLGTTQQFLATGTYTDGSVQDLTATATWASTVPGFATINSTGLATTVAEGQTMISATVGAATNSVAFTVTTAALIRIDVTPANPSIPTTTSQVFTATGVYTNNPNVDLTSQATWSSSNTSIATMVNNVATGLSAGDTTITATFGTSSGFTVLTVNGLTLESIDVTTASPTVPVGFNAKFTATGHFSGGATQDITSDVLWESVTQATATISNAAGSQGLATANAAGTTEIKATLAGITGQTTLTVVVGVLDSIDVLPSAPSIPQGLTQQFTAAGHFNGNTIVLDITEQANWGSSILGVATISNAAGTRGLATGVLQGGPVTITAQVMGGSGSTTVTVTAPELISIAITPTGAGVTVAVGAMLPFTATGTYTSGPPQDITQLVTWTSQEPAVLTVTTGGGMGGIVSGIAAGSTTITAELNGKTTSTPVNVQ